MRQGLALAAAFCLAALASPAAAQVNATSPAADGETGAVLVYSRTEGWRHDSIDEAWSAIAAIAHGRGWSVTFTEDSSWFDAERLAQFDAVVWASASGDTLSDPQKASFRSFVENGGGFVGLHSAGDASHTWDWYAQELIGARFIGHPLNPGVRSGTVLIEDGSHLATRDLPERWYRLDEWYSFDTSVRGRFHVLATLDERSYVRGAWVDGNPIPAADDHPIVWNRCVGEGRSFYSAMGHTAESYSEEGMRNLIAGGISWAMGEGDCPEIE
ncbi:ThuA domain-containing protein [Aurantiacibacter sp. MUD61]|uniref:ThuA domain-containing protein n=1 Tax=Aurantiacibacter sp. MUD61 TaxID=3009083 RepID=UPI0022F013BC|nr:ThuA domain-containing protein [Aurantiacibacter sp. MUD61]